MSAQQLLRNCAGLVVGLMASALLCMSGCGQNASISSSRGTAGGPPKKDVLIESDPIAASKKPPGREVEIIPPDPILVPDVGELNHPAAIALDGARPPLRTPGEDIPPDWVPGDYRPLGFESITLAELDKPLEPPPEAKDLRRIPDPERKGEFCDVWFDRANKRVVMAGRIVRRTGPMEVFACLHRTKEHESIVSIRTKAFAVHALLIALGCSPGRPVQFHPKYQSAEGPEIEVTVHWTDEQGERRSARAQDWLLNEKTGRELEQPWVFGGSGFWKDDDGTSHYLAESGDFICVSNFNSAMLDLPIESSQSNHALMFSAFTKRIPPVGTPVAVMLTPKSGRRSLPAPPPDKKAKEPASVPETPPAAARVPLKAPEGPELSSAPNRSQPRAGRLPLFPAPPDSGPEVFEPTAVAITRTVVPRPAANLRPALAAPVKKFSITPRKSTDHVTVVYEARGVVFVVRSRDGIGQAEIKLRQGEWPESVVVHLDCSMLESFHANTGQVHVSGSLSEGDLPPVSFVGGHGTLLLDGKPVNSDSPYFLFIRRLDTSRIEVRLPASLFEKQPARLTISWIDAFRG